MNEEYPNFNPMKPMKISKFQLETMFQNFQ